MPKKFLKEVVTNVAGKQAEEIVELLSGDKYINEFLIAKKLDITINQTRNILYKLSDHGIVSSTRKKDKRKGWYTYFWKIEISKALEILKGQLDKRISQLNNQVESRESKTFYICERCNIEYNEENALLHDFTCNECGDVFTIKDNSKVLRELKKNLERYRNELHLVEEEISKEKEKFEKKIARETKKEEKKKAAKKIANKLIKKSAKKDVKKPAKKAVKKPTKKVAKAVKPKAKKSIKKPAKKAVKKPTKKTSKKSSTSKKTKSRK